MIDTENEEKKENTEETEQIENIDSEEQNDEELSIEEEVIKEEKEATVDERIKRQQLDFDEIFGDELLPEHEVEKKGLNLSLKNIASKNTVAKAKGKGIKLSTILIALILIIGSIIFFVIQSDKSIVEDNTIIFEVPTFTVQLYSDADKSLHNVKLSIALGVKATDLKDYSTTEGNNLVYNAATQLKFEDVTSMNAQDIIREKVKTVIAETSSGKYDVKVYVSGIDTGNVNMSGLTN